MSSPVVFNRLIRFIHWGIALSVLLNLFIIEDGELPHRLLGYSAVALVAVRFAYGLLIKNHRQFPNKIAHLTYILMWTSIICLGFSGFLLGTETFWGDELVEEIHEFLALFLKTLVVLHLLGISFDSYKHNRRTWLNMINGKSNQ